MENEPSSPELINIPNIEKTISQLLSEIVKSNSNKKVDNNDPFASKKITNVTIKYYIERIKKYTFIENSTLIMALIYIDRICGQNNLALNPYNIHRILFATCLVALKFNEDVIYDNTFYAEVAGISIEECNLLEHCCLRLLNFNLYVSHELFEKYLGYLNDEEV